MRTVSLSNLTDMVVLGARDLAASRFRDEGSQSILNDPVWYDNVCLGYAMINGGRRSAYEQREAWRCCLSGRQRNDPVRQPMRLGDWPEVKTGCPREHAEALPTAMFWLTTLASLDLPTGMHFV